MITILEDLRAQIERKTVLTHVPFADAIVSNVPIYSCANLNVALDDPNKRSALKAELANVLLSGSGVFALKGAFQDMGVLDNATDVFLKIIADEKEHSGEKLDHFAKKGANDRIWNSLEKLCMADPQVFARYHSNRWIELASEAWLGPYFQMTAQVNLVHPGGAAQEAHCDYHLGFLTQEQVNAYPPHVHAFSPQLTLQGAVAHCDMPIESGPTKLLPYSQNWSQNYACYRDPKVRALFDDEHIQVPLEKGDLLFFSPGLLHGAGENVSSDIERMANLLQVSSAFGVAMENINRAQMCKTLYPVLASGDFGEGERNALIASAGAGYAFPTNLDTDPPVGGLAPQTQQALFKQALTEGWSLQAFSDEMDKREAKRSA